MVEREQDSGLDVARFRLRILIRHRDMDPAKITAALCLAPNVQQKAGDPRVTPRGIAIPGRYARSIWSHSFGVDGERMVTPALINLLGILEQKRPFFEELKRNDAETSVLIDLSGFFNVACELSSEAMQRLADLGVEFGFEVFPHDDLSRDHQK